MRCAVPLLGAMVLMLAACGHSSHTAANRLIVPGVSIGNVRFGESRSAVEQALGPGKRLSHPLRGSRRLNPPSSERSPLELLRRDVRVAGEPRLSRDHLLLAPGSR